ncbi:MAG: helix-turn-helix transcriptional regulator [Polyangiales bacterium]
MSTSFRKNIGRAIRAQRHARGSSIEALAGKAGIDPAYLGAVERGDRNPTLDVVDRICVGLGIEPSELLTRDVSLSDDDLRERIHARLREVDRDALVTAWEFVRRL